MTIENYFKRIRPLVQFKNKSDKEVLEIARKRFEIDELCKEVGNKFSNNKEKKQARILYGKYLDDYDIQTISDKNVLAELVYLEVVQSRLQEQMSNATKVSGKAVPIQMLDAIQKNLDAILKLKNSLGLNKSKNKESAYDVLEHLKQRAKVWRDQNQACREARCPHCSKMILFMIRMDKYDAKKHPFFKDNRLYNKQVWKLYKQGKLTKKDVALIMECSVDYVDWAIERIEGKHEEEIQLPKEDKT